MIEDKNEFGHFLLSVGDGYDVIINLFSNIMDNYGDAVSVMEASEAGKNYALDLKAVLALICSTELIGDDPALYNMKMFIESTCEAYSSVAKSYRVAFKFSETDDANENFVFDAEILERIIVYIFHIFIMNKKDGDSKVTLSVEKFPEFMKLSIKGTSEKQAGVLRGGEFPNINLIHALAAKLGGRVSFQQKKKSICFMVELPYGRKMKANCMREAETAIVNGEVVSVYVPRMIRSFKHLLKAGEISRKESSK